MRKFVLALMLSFLISFPVYATGSLIDKGADWWAEVTPEVLEQTIAKGASINEKDKIKWTPLMYALYYNQNPEIVETLIKHGADVKAKDKNGKTALDYAKDNPKIYRTDAYWHLNDLMYK